MRLLISMLLLLLPLLHVRPQDMARQAAMPILELPEPGFDDPARYNEYATRFYKDAAGNAVQIVLNGGNGRVVHLWADDANESVGFTVRKPGGSPVKAAWGRPGAEVSSEERTRRFTYHLRFPGPRIEIGHVLLHSMRVERDFQYQKGHLEPFRAGSPVRLEEVERLLENLDKLSESVRRDQLSALNASSVNELRARVAPAASTRDEGSVRRWSIEQPTLDGVHTLALEVRVDARRFSLEAGERSVSIAALGVGGPSSADSIELTLELRTNASALTPLSQEEIFNEDFRKYYESVRSRTDTGGAVQLHWLDRQVKGLELVSYREKLMAGLPNFATYFGRDMMMSALMMEQIWKPGMLEHVVGSVLRKLSPSGEVSHEEALGWQAIRENAAEYNRLAGRYFGRLQGPSSAGSETAALDRILDSCLQVLRNIQTVRENYRMVDDDFQLPVLAGRYLGRTDLDNSRKREFLEARAVEGSPGDSSGVSRLRALLRNLMMVARQSSAYVHQRTPTSLVGFPRQDARRWHPGSWRDSQAGYANGRFAMDINAIWVPNALRAIGTIGRELRAAGYEMADLKSTAPELAGSELETYFARPDSLQAAVGVWQDAWKHFEVRVEPGKLREQIRAYLAWLPPAERKYWQEILKKETKAGKEAPTRRGIEFLALSLDEQGKPIPVMHTDLATQLFLEGTDSTVSQRNLALLGTLLRPYPLGLFVENLGVLVANDAHAPRSVWESFRADRYHSPYVVWGREVNLLELGLARAILSLSPAAPARETPDSPAGQMRLMLGKIVKAVERSGLKHNELWSYRIGRGRLLPERYASSSDLQLWNLTDLSVQFLLSRMSAR